MTGNAQTSGDGIGGRRFQPVVSLFAAGLVYAVLPHGAFGTHDIAARAAVAGLAAAVTMLLLTRRRLAR